MRKFWRILTAFRVAALVLVLLVCGILLYLHWVGFPQFVQRHVKSELAAKGVEARWSALRFDLIEGVVAQNAEFYEMDGERAKIAEAERVAIHIRPLRLARGMEALKGVTISRARVAIAEPERFFAGNGAVSGAGAKASRFTAEEATVVVRFPRAGVIEVAELTGVYAGLRLNVSGVIYLSPAAQRPRAQGNPTMVREILRELNALRADPSHPPEVTIRFEVDTAREREARVELHIRARNVSYTARTGDVLRIDALEAGAFVQEQSLEVRRFRCALYGGEIVATKPCYYDLGQARMFAALRSTTNLKKLEPFLPPPAKRALADLEFASNPTIACEIEFSENTGAKLAVRRGFAEARNFSFRAVPFRAARCRWEFAEAVFSVSDAQAEMPDGRVTGSYSVQTETTQFAAKLDGTFSPKTIAPLMTEKQREFLAQFEFDDAVRAINAEIRGNWHFPKEIQIVGKLELGRWRWRGESFTGLVAEVRFANETVTFSDATVRRQEGEARGGFSFDGENGWLTVAAQGTLLPKQLLVAAFPQARAVLEPYDVESPVKFDVRVKGNVKVPDAMVVEGRAQFGKGAARGVAVRGGEAEFRHESGIVRVPHFELNREEGTAAGALVWDTKRQTVHGEIISTLDVQQVAPIFGEVFARAVAPYQFDSPPLIWAQGTIAVAEPKQTQIKSRIEGNEFTLIAPKRERKALADGQAVAPPNRDGGGGGNANGNGAAAAIRLRASRITGDLSYGSNTLSLRNVDAEFYGGRLRGNADFFFQKEGVGYRGALVLEKANLAPLLKAFTNKDGNVSGLLSGSAQFDEGNFSDINTMKGRGHAYIVEGHLVDVPVFGLASFILNMLPGKLGNSKARAASANFAVENGVIRTEDMAVETGGTKTTMKGTVTWDGAIDFEVRTRGSNLINFIFDPIRWLSDAHVTGTLDKPEVNPLRLK
jgi:hypothetical protein